jgi:hypothetical protein
METTETGTSQFHMNIIICADVKTEWNISFMQFCSVQGVAIILSPARVVCTNDVAEHIFFVAKNFILQEITITL